MDDWKKINRFLQVCLDIAEWHDKKGEEDRDWQGGEMTEGIGLGYKAMTSYLRNGVQEVVKLQDKYHTTKERQLWVESNAKSKIEFLAELFGEEDPEEFSDKVKIKFRQAAREAIDEQEREWAGEQ